jgi:Zn-dependent peptidase ImmA (M78 family)
MKSLVGTACATLSSFDFITCSVDQGGGTCRLFELIEQLADQYLEKGKVDCSPVPVDLIHLLDTQSLIDIRQVELKKLHSALWRQDDGWVIQLNSRDSACTRRYSLFHEGFHILAHRKTTPVFRKIDRVDGAFNEFLAGYFASSILMPRDWVLQRWKQVGNLGDMVRLFEVPDSMMYIRLRQFGLISDAADVARATP